MAKKQSRRSVSVRGVTYNQLREHCARSNISMSDLLEELVAAHWKKNGVTFDDPACVPTKPPPAHKPAPRPLVVRAAPVAPLRKVAIVQKPAAAARAGTTPVAVALKPAAAPIREEPARGSTRDEIASSTRIRQSEVSTALNDLVADGLARNHIGNRWLATDDGEERVEAGHPPDGAAGRVLVYLAAQAGVHPPEPARAPAPLATIANKGPARSAPAEQIARATGAALRTAVDVLTRLEDRDLVERHRDDTFGLSTGGMQHVRDGRVGAADFADKILTYLGRLVQVVPENRQARRLDPATVEREMERPRAANSVGRPAPVNARDLVPRRVGGPLSF